MDLVTVNRNDDSISLFVGKGDGSFYAARNIALKDGRFLTDAPQDMGVGPTSVAIGDLNKDGYPDMVVTRCLDHCTKGSFVFLYGKGNGEFYPPAHKMGGVAPYNLTLADLNEDGYPDLVSSDYPSSELLVLLSDGKGKFEEPYSYPTGRKPISLEISDLDRDGYLDVVSSDHGDLGSTIYYGESGGRLGRRQFYRTATLPYSIALGDMNHDGLPDLVVAHSTPEGKISIHLGDGEGNFKNSDELEVGNPLIFVALADFDKDGNLDVITTNVNEQYAVVYFGLEDGILDRNFIRIPSENKIYSLALGDFNSDGFIDLASVDFEKGTLFIALGKRYRRPKEH